MMKFYKRWCPALLNALILAALLSLSACGGGSSGAGQQPTTTSTMIGTVSTGTTSYLLNSAGLPIGATPVYAVNYYKITYETVTPSGSTVTASGLLLVPQKNGASSPLFSLQHGTTNSQVWIPSNFNINNQSTYAYDTLAGLVAASFGYVVVMPDFLGYGASSGMFHPYVQAGSLASSTVDMIRASKTVLTQLGAPNNGQLFLAGYSEGGYATLATQREIETNLTSEFTITASEPGAGPYNLSGTTQLILGKADLAGNTDPYYLAFLMVAYDTYYNSTSHLSNYFTANAFNCVGSYFGNGWYGTDASGNSFDACLGTTVTTSILDSTFVNAMNNNDPGIASLKIAIADNDIYNWKPQVPTRLYYSPYDESVPASNSTDAYTAMTNNGSTSVATATCPLPSSYGTFHGPCSLYFYSDVVGFFAPLANNL